MFSQEPEITETYSVNGVNYTTYTTFRSPITPEECDSISNRYAEIILIGQQLIINNTRSVINRVCIKPQGPKN